MAATFNWWGEYGDSGSPTTGDLGVSGNLFNFKNLDSLASAADYTDYPITAGNNSFEVWLKGHFTDSFNRIQNIKFWKSVGSFGTGETILWDGTTEVYVTPVATASAIAISALPTANPASANVSIGGSLSGYLTSAGYSDFIIMQMQTEITADAGDTETFTFTLTYDEN
jgi:hypothetical protein